MLHCEEWAELNAWWMNDGAGRSDCYRFIYEHLHSCPVCLAIAATFEPPSKELVERIEQGRYYDTLAGWAPPRRERGVVRGAWNGARL